LVLSAFLFLPRTCLSFSPSFLQMGLNDAHQPFRVKSVEKSENRNDENIHAKKWFLIWQGGNTHSLDSHLHNEKKMTRRIMPNKTKVSKDSSPNALISGPVFFLLKSVTRE
jgi:hypothetical protein